MMKLLATTALFTLTTGVTADDSQFTQSYLNFLSRKFQKYSDYENKLRFLNANNTGNGTTNTTQDPVVTTSTTKAPTTSNKTPTTSSTTKALTTSPTKAPVVNENAVTAVITSKVKASIPAPSTITGGRRLAVHIDGNGNFVGSTCTQYGSFMTGKVNTATSHQAFASVLGLPVEKYGASGNGGYTVATSAGIKGKVCGDSDVTGDKLDMTVTSVVTLNVASVAEANIMVKAAKDASTALNTAGVSDNLLAAINTATGLTLTKADIVVEVITFSVKKGSGAAITDLTALESAAAAEIAANSTTPPKTEAKASDDAADVTTKAETAGAFEQNVLFSFVLAAFSSMFLF